MNPVYKVQYGVGRKTRTYYVEGNDAQDAMRHLKHKLGKSGPTVLDGMRAELVDREDVPSVFPIVRKDVPA